MKNTIQKTVIILFLLVTSKYSFSQSSVLSSGDWYKISVVKDGIYFLTRSDLNSLGINLIGLDPRYISLYGNKAGMLPLKNNVPHINDLQELAIEIKGESDGIFDSGDTLFFYGQSQHIRVPDYNLHRFSGKTNIYSDSTFYFLTIGSVAGKRIAPKINEPTFTNTTSIFSEFYRHELDSVNVLKFGKQWFGEYFSALGSPQRTFSFNTSHITLSSFLEIHTELLGRSHSTAHFKVTSGVTTVQQIISPVGSSTIDPYGIRLKLSLMVPAIVVDSTIVIELISSDSSCIGYLDFLELNFNRDLYLLNSQMIFSDFNSIGSGNITKYSLSNATAAVKVWDITDPVNVSNQAIALNASTIEFNAQNDSLHTYIAFDGQLYFHPTLNGRIANQDLHSISQANYIVVTVDEFLQGANTLAAFHQAHDNLQSVVVTANQIYNEYSTGAQDPVAIRDFIRQVFNRSAANNDSLKYVLLFGSGSYDYRGILGQHSSFVPAYESEGSLNPIQTFCNDFFYTFMNDTSGDGEQNYPDLAIGRIPIRNANELSVINKIMNYSAPSTIGSWRKGITFVADDGASNIFFRQSDTLANRIENNNCPIDIRKIYVDSYVRDTTNMTYSYPDVENQILDCLNKGTLAIHYTGYGGILGWAHERIFDTLILNSVNHSGKLAFFLNATSNLNEFDDPENNSIGRIIAMSPTGGGIASLSNGRLSFSNSDYNFYQAIYRYILSTENGMRLSIGDIVKKAKQDYRDPYVASVCLLGDPAVFLNYPKHEIVTTSINGLPASQGDTLIPGGPVTLQGEVHDENGNLMPQFNGTIELILFDNKTLHYTLANDPISSFIAPFYAWDDTLIKINAQVFNGSFNASFNLPWDIDSGYGIGRISYYAFDTNDDAAGCYENVFLKNLTPGIDEIDDLTIDVSPNPSVDNITFTINSKNSKKYMFSIIDIEGRRQFAQEINSNSFVLSKDKLSRGIYIYEILDSKNKMLKRGKIVFE